MCRFLPWATITVVLILSAPPLIAQTGPPQRRTPERDNTSKPADGAGVVRGRVVAADGGRPLRRAHITLFAPELGSEGRTSSTDVNGRYELNDLPPARYRVSVTRGGYLPLQYGQRRPGEQGRPVQVRDGEIVDHIDFALPRMSVISGRVTDETGEPIEGVSVYANALSGSGGGTVSGGLIVEGGPPPKMSSVRVLIAEPFRGQPSPVLLGAFRNVGATMVKEDGTFSVSHVFGHARFQVTVPDGWMLKSVLSDGKDIADSTLDLTSGQEINP